MGIVAVTNIKHGKDDGEFVTFAPGEEITGLPDDVVKEYLDSRAAVDTSDIEAVEVLVSATNDTSIVNCPECLGTGSVNHEECPTCNGMRVVRAEAEDLQVADNPGVPEDEDEDEEQPTPPPLPPDDDGV